jgi:signal transduction histidine kinase/type II secretory pathway pseudopilin PulG
MRRTQIPYGLLVVGLALTAAAAQYASRTATARDRLRFDNAAAAVKSAIDSRLDAYIAMLLGGAGLFAASEQVQLPEFRAYVERLELARRYPGIQGIGFSRVVRPDERNRIAAAIRQYAPSFDYQGGSTDSTVHAIVFLEPLDERNRVALGYDMYSESTRRAAMDLARDTGAPAATHRVRLVQEIDPDKQQAGFLIYVPVYVGGAVPATVEERRSKLLGFVYSPFRAGDLLSGIEGATRADELTFDVFDGSPGEDRLLHQSHGDGIGARFRTELVTEVAGQRWTLVVRSGPTFARTSGRALAMLIAIGGALLSASLFGVTKTQISARDAAERTADDLRRSEEALRTANLAKEEFLAVVSHELRTPLNAIVGWTAMLRRSQVPPETQVHAIRVIERNAAAQARLIEDLLDISRAVAGRLRLERGNVDVGGLLKSAVDALRPEAARQRVQLETELPATLGTITADSGRLQQVVLNILSNGIKFTGEAGTVSLSAWRDADWVTVRIADTGMGIPADFLPHVFERFRQADASTTRAHSGIGLGLAISRHIVELHGGTIEAASGGEGRGTTVTIRLPSHPPRSV